MQLRFISLCWLIIIIPFIYLRRFLFMFMSTVTLVEEGFMAKKKEVTELSPYEKLKEEVRKDRPDLNDEEVEKETALRFRTPQHSPVGHERGGQPTTEPVRTEDNPKPQGTF